MGQTNQYVVNSRVHYLGPDWSLPVDRFVRERYATSDQFRGEILDECACYDFRQKIAFMIRFAILIGTFTTRRVAVGDHF
jgi:hypothetical protein